MTRRMFHVCVLLLATTLTAALLYEKGHALTSCLVTNPRNKSWVECTFLLSGFTSGAAPEVWILDSNYMDVEWRARRSAPGPNGLYAWDVTLCHRCGGEEIFIYVRDPKTAQLEVVVVYLRNGCPPCNVNNNW